MPAPPVMLGQVEWTLAIVAAAVLAVAAVSRRLSGTPITPAMVFVAIGVLVGPEVFDVVDLSPASASVRALAEATLTLVLFSDASRIDLRRSAASSAAAAPARDRPAADDRAGALAAARALRPADYRRGAILAVMLAPTDAALGQAVVTEPRVPARSARASTSRAGSTTGSASRCSSSSVAAADVDADIASGRTRSPSCSRRSATGSLGGVAAGCWSAAARGRSPGAAG